MGEIESSVCKICFIVVAQHYLGRSNLNIYFVCCGDVGKTTEILLLLTDLLLRKHRGQRAAVPGQGRTGRRGGSGQCQGHHQTPGQNLNDVILDDIWHGMRPI